MRTYRERCQKICALTWRESRSYAHLHMRTYIERSQKLCPFTWRGARRCTHLHGEEPEDMRTYICISVSKHKTPKTNGSAFISLSEQEYRDLLAYIKLPESL